MLSKKTQYSLYALLHLAKQYGMGPVLISEIAEKEKIPRKFLENILLELKNNGFVGSKKGKGGGYYLIKNPEQINLADIIRLFDGAIALLPCAAYKYYQPCSHCRDEEKCGLRSVIKEIRDETVNMMKSKTLAGILEKEKLL
jgi:Rrf2 family protein